MTEKCVCVIDKQFDFGSKMGGFIFSAKKGKIYEYYIYDGMCNVSENSRIYYPILSIFFNPIFVNLNELRNRKLTELGI